MVDEKKHPNRYEQWRPYYIVDSLDDLKGPASGTVELHLGVYWQPGTKTFDVGTEVGAFAVYEAVISEGNEADLVRYLNKDLLIRLWPNLSLPIKAVHMWADRFPELRGNMRESWLR